MLPPSPALQAAAEPWSPFQSRTRRRSGGYSPPASAAAGSPSTSKSSAELMLLLMRANVPNAVMFNAKTERELALLAVSYEISLPKHLSHLPTLPPVRSESELAALESELARAAWDPMAKEAIKDRPPRRTTLFLRSAPGAHPLVSPTAVATGAPAPQ